LLRKIVRNQETVFSPVDRALTAGKWEGQSYDFRTDFTECRIGYIEKESQIVVEARLMHADTSNNNR